MLMMLHCCLCPSAACCDLHALLCQSSCNAVGLDDVTTLEQLYDAVLNQSLYVSAVPYNVDDAAVLLVSICCIRVSSVTLSNFAVTSVFWRLTRPLVSKDAPLTQQGESQKLPD